MINVFFFGARAQKFKKGKIKLLSLHMIYEKLSQFDGTQEAAFYAWSKKIVMNKGLSFYRRKYYTLENLITLNYDYQVNTLRLTGNIENQLQYQFASKSYGKIDGISVSEVSKGALQAQNIQLGVGMYY